MNDLTKFLVDSILNEDTIPGKTALFGGGFKPPTRGHLDVVLQGLKDNPEVDEVYIFVGSGVRNNISQEESIKIWEMYKPLIPIKTTIIKAGAPLRDMKRFIEDTEDKPYIFIGARPNNEEDEKDVAERSKFFEKYGGIPKRVSTADSNVSGTRARNAAKANNKEELFSYFPDALSDAQKEEIYKMLLSVVAEQIDFKSLEQQLDNMFAELDIDVAFTTHFKERVLERGLTEDDILELAEKIIDAYPDQLDFLNQGQNIVMSHLSRLVDIAAVNTGYGDDYLKDLVFKTAFKRKDKSEPEFRTNASSPRLAVKEKKDPKKGTGKKPKGSSRRLYTDEDPKDTVRVKFSTRQDIVDTLNKKSFKAKSHARQSQIINLIHQRVRAAYNRAKDPDVKKRLKTALDYAEQRKEASKKKTQRLKKQKNENTAPNHDGKAAPFGSGYDTVKEGDTIEKYSAKGKKTGKLKQGTVRKRLNIPKDEKIPMYKINKELSRLKKMDKDKDKKGVQLGDKNQKYYKALQLAKTLKSTTHVNEGIIDVTPKEEKLLRKVAKEYIIPALRNRVHDEVLVTMKYKLSNGEDGKVGFYVYNKDDNSAAHFNSQDDKDKFDNLIGINAFENELAFAGGLEQIYTRLTGDSPFRDLLDSLRHEFIHAKDPGANNDTFAAKHTGKTFADYYGGWIEFPAQTGEFLLAIKNNTLDYIEEKGRLTTKDTEYLSNVFQDILDFYARNASMNEMSPLVIDFFTQGKSTGFQKFIKKIIDFGGDTLGIRTTPDWSQSDAFEKFYTKLRRIRNFNEEGYKEFQKDLYVLIQKLIEQTNKDLPQGVKPIYAGGKNRLNENASYSKEINIREKIDQLTQHMIDKGMNIEPLPSLEFVDGDTENARDFFGKTAYYDPNTQTIVLYTEGRHPKDIVRSYAHEMIHHIQYLEGRLGNITTTNTQEDDALNKIEAEANLKGTMTFRNWTDSLNEIGDASAGVFPYKQSRINTIVDTLKTKIDIQPDAKWQQHLLPFLSFNSPNAEYNVITTAQVDKPLNLPDFQATPPTIDLRVDFTVGESDEATNIGEQYKVMATMTQIIKELIAEISKLKGPRLESVKIFPKSDDGSEESDVDSKRGKLYKAYVEKNLPQGWKIGSGKDARGSYIALYPSLKESGQKIAKKNMDDYKKSNNPSGKVSDPFGLNAFAYELARLDEGAYDSLVTKLTNATINKWVEDSKQKPLPKKSFVDIDIDEEDGKGREIEFNYVGIVEFDKKIDGYEVDGTSNSGEDEGKMPFVATMFRINPKILPQAWSKISADVSDVIRHEIEHLTQAGDNVRGQVYDDEGNLISKGKYMEDDIMIRDMINKLKVLPKSDYYKLEKEVDAMLQGLYLKAKKTKKPFADVINNYLDMAPGIETKEDKEAILNLWRSRRKALSLPIFEDEKMPKSSADLFTIYLDMDGVIVDFDKQFEEQFGMPPREFENNFGTDKFWEKIDSKGVGFWRGMDWMPGGQQLYNRVSQYNHFLLSSPSRSEKSKIGKRLWRRDNTPDTKLILSRSYNKKNYADKSNILIDDRADNIQQWKDAGGIGILYQSADQVMKELDKLGL